MSTFLLFYVNKGQKKRRPDGPKERQTICYQLGVLQPALRELKARVTGGLENPGMRLYFAACTAAETSSVLLLQHK